MRHRVTEAWTRSYDDPIRIAAGAPLTLTGKADDWEGHVWLWARDGAGREGWVPDDLVGSDGCARTAFNALELSVVPGDELEVLERTHGWALCRSAAGSEGWIPERVLAQERTD